MTLQPFTPFQRRQFYVVHPGRIIRKYARTGKTFKTAIPQNRNRQHEKRRTQNKTRQECQKQKKIHGSGHVTTVRRSCVYTFVMWDGKRSGILPRFDGIRHGSWNGCPTPPTEPDRLPRRMHMPACGMDVKPARRNTVVHVVRDAGAYAYGAGMKPARPNIGGRSLP